jgi:hypothetical protein
MGYYTRYTLTVTPEDRTEQIRAAFCVVSGYSHPFDNECKWYDFDEHLVAVSCANPDVLITVDGEGEEQGDVWRAYARKGVVVTYRPGEWTLPSAPKGWTP